MKDRLKEAAIAARQSPFDIAIEVEIHGLKVVGRRQSFRVTVGVMWDAIENARINPLTIAVERVERELERASAEPEAVIGL